MHRLNAPRTDSAEEIRAFLVERLKAALPGTSLEARHDQPFRLTVSHPEAGRLVLNLGNIVQELRGATPVAAEEMVDTFVRLAKRAVAPPKIDYDNVYPGFRHRAHLDAVKSGVADALVGPGPGDLITVVLADQGDCVATLNETTVRAAGFDPEDILLAAEQNLVDILPNAFCAGTSDDDVLSLGLSDFPWLGTSVLLVPSLISRVMEEKGWDHVLLAAPTRETVDLVDAERADAARAMERWMMTSLAGPRTQSEVVYSFRCNDTIYRKSYRVADGDLYRLN